MKRGFAVSFSWLFSIMAGIAIFLFLIGFAYKNTDLFGTLTSQIAVEELDTAFSGFKGSLVSTNLDFGKPVEIKLNCIDDVGEKIFVNNKGGKTLKGKLVFGPSLMEDSEYIIWTKDWRVPFKVTNFIYLIEKNKRYEFIGNKHDETDISGREVFNVMDIPEQMKSLVSNGGEFVDFKELSSYGGCVNNEKIIYWDYDEDLKDVHGFICLNREEFEFVGSAMMYAAIFSDNDDKYFRCMYEIAEDKAEIIAKIHREKLNLNPICGININFNLLDVSSIDRVNDLVSKNDLLLRENNCRSVY